MSSTGQYTTSPDAAASQPSAHPVPLRPYKTLAPKPTQKTWPIVESTSRAPPALLLRPALRTPICAVCQRASCQLVSHKTFLRFKLLKGKDTARNLAIRPHHNSPDEAVYKQSYAFQFASFVDVSLAASRIDPFIGLPIPESSHPQLHRLLHDCKGFYSSSDGTSSFGNVHSNTWVPVFTVNLDRVLTFPRPSGLIMDPVAGAIAPAAMTDPAVCLSIVAASALSVGLRTGQQARNATALSFYRQAMQVLHERTLQDPASPTDQTIMAAATLWGVTVYFGDATTVKQHRKSVCGLVTLRGGRSALGLGGMLSEYVLWFDMFAALFLKEAPFFDAQAGPVPSQAQTEATYGTAFYNSSIIDLLHPHLIEICVVHCRMTELLEEAILHGTKTQDYMSFYAMLRWTSIRRPQLLAIHYDSGTVDECVGIAVEIYKANILAKQEENRSFMLGHCSQLQHALLRTDVSSSWGEHIQLLIWILFVVGTIYPGWDTRKWFIGLLRRAISATYQNKTWWPLWREQALHHLTDFIWSKLRFEEAFEKICDELESMDVSGVASGPLPSAGPP